MAEPLRKLSPAEAELWAASEAWAEAAERCDLEACVAFYARDAAILGTHAPVALGQEEIRRHWQQRMHTSVYQLRLYPVSLELSDAQDLACQVGHYDLLQRVWEEGPEQSFHGYFMVVWVRTTDRHWRIRWDLYNVAERHPRHAPAA